MKEEHSITLQECETALTLKCGILFRGIVAFWKFLHKGCLYIFICQGSKEPFRDINEDEVKRRSDYSDYDDDVERGVPLESIDKETI